MEKQKSLKKGERETKQTIVRTGFEKEGENSALKLANFGIEIEGIESQRWLLV